MAWDVPNFVIDIPRPDFVGYADRLMGAYQQGRAQRQQQDVLDARRAIGQEAAALPPGGSPNYQSYAQRLLGAGDMEGAGLYQRLGQTQEDRAYRQSRDTIEDGFKRQQLEISRQRAGESAAGYGLNPIYGTDAQGRPVIMQIGKNGQAVQTQMPDGVSLARDPIKLDAGTHFILLDPQTRQPVGQVPKDVAGAAAAKAVGTAAGEAQAQLPGAESMAAQIGQHVDALANDPYLPNMVGPMASRMPNVTAEAARVQARMDQLKGGVFLQGYQMLKGGGAVTEIEGLKAENAMARLSAAQSVEDYRQALGEFRDALTTGLAKLRSQASMVPGAAQNPGAPGGGGAPAQRGGGLAPGTVVKGYVYRGGNPKDPNSWGRAQ